jgi:cobalt-zinc-cadmium efflux system outer membrane protein
MIALPLLLAAQLGAVPATDAPLTLSAAVTEARTSSPRRRGAVFVADGARDAARAAGRLPNPVFELRTENWSPSTRAASPALDVFAVITQPLELGGKRSIRRRLAESEHGVAVAALRSLDTEIALETVRAYVRALRARARVETLAGNHEGLATLVANVGRQVGEGYTAEADLLKFMTEAARVDGEIARARLELDRSLSALAILTGAAAPIRAAQLVEPPAVPLPAFDAAAVAAAVARHPRVRAAAAGLELARQVTALERASRLPDPLVTGGYKRTAGFDTAVLGVMVSVPLFDRSRASIARSEGLERGAAADRDALAQQLARETEAMMQAAETIAARAARAPQELLAPAGEVRRAALAAFREGAADALKLIDAERVYADARQTVTDLRLDALLTAIEARFALGEEAVP